MIRLSHLTLGYGSRTLLRHVSTTFPQARLTALIGRNGTGKSTLLRTLAGLRQPQGGEIIIEASSVSSDAPLPMSRLVAYVGTGRVRVPSMSCREVVALGRAPYTDWLGNLAAADRRAVDAALEQTGMTTYAARPLDSLSDGEAQRVMIARALAQDTPVILLDEPTSFLDIPGRYALCELLRSLAVDAGKCILFSTHELPLALETAHAIALIDPPHLHNLPVSSPELESLLQRLFPRR